RDATRETARRLKADRRSCGLTRDERNACRVRRDRKVRDRGAACPEEFQRRRRTDVALAEAPSAPYVLDQFQQGIVGVRGRGLVRLLGRGATEPGIDQRRSRISFVVCDEERSVF